MNLTLKTVLKTLGYAAAFYVFSWIVGYLAELTHGKAIIVLLGISVLACSYLLAITPRRKA